MQYNEIEFYKHLLELINLDLKSKSLKAVDLLNTDYIISRTQYYNMKKVAEGNESISRLSHKRLLEICSYLGIEINDFLFDVSTK